MAQAKRDKNPDTPEMTSKYYITNGRMLPEVIKSKEAGRINDELAKMFMMLTHKYARRPCFSSYTYKEDMISDALTSLCQNALKFDPIKYDNPFAYYTTCINNSFLQFLNTEKKHRRIRDQLLIDIGENPSFSFQEESRYGENSDDIAELKTNIEEAKVRMAQDEIYAAAKAAKDANSKLVEKIIEIEEVLTLDIEVEVISLELEAELVPNLDLLEFEKEETKD
jgi:DNA-directed RNA polymerase specialized sigma subunit